MNQDITITIQIGSISEERVVLSIQPEGDRTHKMSIISEDSPQWDSLGTHSVELIYDVLDETTAGLMPLPPDISDDNDFLGMSEWKIPPISDLEEEFTPLALLDFATPALPEVVNTMEYDGRVDDLDLSLPAVEETTTIQILPDSEVPPLPGIEDENVFPSTEEDNFPSVPDPDDFSIGQSLPDSDVPPLPDPDENILFQEFVDWGTSPLVSGDDMDDFRGLYNDDDEQHHADDNELTDDDVPD